MLHLNTLWGFFVGMVLCGLIYHFGIIPEAVQRGKMLERTHPISTSTGVLAPDCMWAQLDAHNRVLVKGDVCECSKLDEGN